MKEWQFPSRVINITNFLDETLLLQLLSVRKYVPWHSLRQLRHVLPRQRKHLLVIASEASR